MLRSYLKPSSAVLGHLHHRSSYRHRRGREALASIDNDKAHPLKIKDFSTSAVVGPRAPEGLRANGRWTCLTDLGVQRRPQDPQDLSMPSSRVLCVRLARASSLRAISLRAACLGRSACWLRAGAACLCPPVYPNPPQYIVPCTHGRGFSCTGVLGSLR